MLPLYKEIGVIDKFGKEKILIKDGRAVEEGALRNVRDPWNTT